MLASGIPNLGNTFSQYFQIVPAFSEVLKQEVYRVRHQVYCEDLKFEPVRPDGRETDEYDPYSLHFLVRSLHNDEFIGCTRIVRPRPDDPGYPLPFEITCADTLDRSIIDPAELPRQRIAEVSRLAVISRYRRRKGEANKAVSISDEDFGTPKLPRFPYLPVGLYLSTFEMARLNGIETLFVLTEERLASHFSKLGFDLQYIGSPVEHHGERLPSMMNVTATIRNIRANLRPLYHTIAADIARGLSISGEEPGGSGGHR